MQLEITGTVIITIDGVKYRQENETVKISMPDINACQLADMIYSKVDPSSRAFWAGRPPNNSSSPVQVLP